VNGFVNENTKLNIQILWFLDNIIIMIMVPVQLQGKLD